MDLSLVHKKKEAEKQAHAFVREFPIMTFKNAHQRYAQCSLWARAKIKSYFNRENDNLLLTIFRFATQIPFDLHKHVIFRLFYDEDATKKFLCNPIKDSYLLYAWAQDVFAGNAGIPSSFKIRSTVLIFRLSDDIKKAETIIQKNNPNFYIGRKDINVLRRMAEGSECGYQIFDPRYRSQFKLSYHGKYRLDDFKDDVMFSGILTALLYLPLILTIASRNIEIGFCKKIALDPLLDSKIKKLTAIVHSLGELDLLDGIKSTQNIIGYSWMDQLKMNIPFLSIVPVIPAIDYFCSPSHLRATFSAILGGIVSAVGLFALSYIPFEKFPDGFSGLFIHIPVVIFTGSCCFSYIENMRWIYGDFLNWDHIDNKLISDSSCVPEESRQE